MAHFARIEDGVVQQVVAVKNAAINGGEFPDSEPLGQALLAESGHAGDWLQCSYSESFRGAYPSKGWTYDAEADEFVPPAVPVQPAPEQPVLEA